MCDRRILFRQNILAQALKTAPKIKWDLKDIKIDRVYLNHLRFAEDINDKQHNRVIGDVTTTEPSIQKSRTNSEHRKTKNEFNEAPYITE